MSTPRRKRNEDGLLLALASGKSVQAAARQAGVCERTVYRRLQEPKFRQRLNELRTDLVERTSGSLTAAGQKAVATLLDLMKPENGATVRLGAAKAVLEVGVKFREVVDQDARFAKLEAKLTTAEEAMRHSHSR